MKGTNITLTFFDYTILPQKPGYKYAIFRIEDPKGSFIGYDWGMCSFENGSFDIVESGEQIARVVKWAEPPVLDTIMKK